MNKLYWLQCKQFTEKKFQLFHQHLMEKLWFLLILLFEIVKKSRFIRNREAKGMLSSLGLKTSLSKAPRLGDILFEIYFKYTAIDVNILQKI